ncbi:MAG: chemotaxis-specific protein-glutamate methyltransferase CheB [Bdellovibrionales bacterium]|nr:chemotaxis-specific protein-glutamate methyltransferase CheB [Bdellovibrionales bacterium]
MNQGTVRILVVEESAEARDRIRYALTAAPEFQIVGEATDAFEARKLLVELRPDIMLLDLHLPKMSGVAFLRKVMKHFPIRTLAMSLDPTQNPQHMLDAIGAGAVDVVKIPTEQTAEELVLLVTKLRTVAAASPRKPQGTQSITDIPQSKIRRYATSFVAIASSTGGTEALKFVLPKIQMDRDAAILVVQHLPEAFMKTYVDLLNKICPFPVKEAVDGEKVEVGTAYLAPGDHHMEIRQAGAQYAVVLHQKPFLHSIRPSADYLLHSIAKLRKPRAIGVILTGMGKDGAEGLAAMRKRGAYNIAQDESTSVVYGMPKEAEKLGGIDMTLPLEEIAEEINRQLRKRNAA